MTEAFGDSTVRGATRYAEFESDARIAGVVLVQEDLIGKARPFLAHQRGPIEEERPKPVPALAVGLHHVPAVLDPALTPSAQGQNVMSTHAFHVFDFEAGV